MSANGQLLSDTLTRSLGDGVQAGPAQDWDLESQLFPITPRDGDPPEIKQRILA